MINSRRYGRISMDVILIDLIRSFTAMNREDMVVYSVAFRARFLVVELKRVSADFFTMFFGIKPIQSPFWTEDTGWIHEFTPIQ